jgi:pyruvate, water dikinase
MANYVQMFSNLNKSLVGVAGGKGAQLGEMFNAGIPVPPGFVILIDSFDGFIADNGLSQRIEAILKKVDPKKTQSVDAASTEIRKLIKNGKISPQIEKTILESFDKLGAALVAVRSSATAEDAADASWAGELESYMNITKNNLLDAVKLCWSSLFTPRAIFYRIEKKMSAQKVSVAVVVQKMV